MKIAGSWPLISFAIAIPVILSPFLFFGYTIAQGNLASDSQHLYRNVPAIGVADPAHSALLGQPYLTELKQELAHGRIPLLNMKNGLGAVGVESLLTCSFYILNPILFLLPTGKPLYYDLFQIIHICILLTGLYFLLRKYSSPFVSVVVSLLITFSGVTYVWINLDIYRNFSWTPWMMLGAVGIARAQNVRRSAWLLSLAVIASITAGNLLETSMDLFAVLVVFSCELYVAADQWRAARVFLLALSGAAMASLVAVLPYIFSMAQGNLYASTNPQRSIQPYDPVWLFAALLPRVTGYYPYIIIPEEGYRPHADLGTVCIWLFLSGVIIDAVRPNRDRKSPKFILCMVIPIVMLIGYAKIVNFPLTNFVQFIPFLSGIAFVKYHLYLYALAAIPMAIGLESYTRLAHRERTFLLILTTGIVAVMLALMAAYLMFRFHSSPTYAAPGVLRMQRETWTVSLAVWLAAVLLCWRQPQWWKQAFVSLAIVQGLALIPAGFGKRMDRFPSAITQQYPVPRTLTRTHPNENLYTATESVEVYDGVVNTRYMQFMNSFYRVGNAYCIFEITNDILNSSQIEALQLIGTTNIQGYKLADSTGLTSQEGPGQNYLVRHPLPNLYVIRQSTFQKLRNVRLDPGSIHDVVTLIQADLDTMPQPFSVERERTTFRFKMPAKSDGVLILNQAYTTYWKLGKQASTPFLNLFPAWPLSAASSEFVISYWPTGLTYGIVLLFPAGIILFLMDRLATVPARKLRGTHSLQAP